MQFLIFSSFMIFLLIFINGVLFFFLIHYSIFHCACKSGNLEVVRFVQSLSQFDINDKTISFFHVLMTFKLVLISYQVFSSFSIHGIFTVNILSHSFAFSMLTWSFTHRSISFNPRAY